MEKQEMEMKQKLETETGNGSWKRKWEQKHTNQGCNIFFIVFLVITLAFYWAMIVWLALWVVLCICSCTVLCGCFWVALMWQAVLQSSLRGSGHKTSCNLTMRVTYLVLEWSQHFSLVPRPTSSFDCLQCVKLIVASYPGPGYNSPIPNTLSPLPNYLPMQKY